MSVLVEDSPRNLMNWIVAGHAAGVARGGVLGPFATPWNNKVGPGARRGAREVAQGLRAAGAEVHFDATTHALQMSGVGDFRYYEDYDLWSGARGELTTPAARTDHVKKVFAIQDDLGAPHLAPTVLLHHGETATSKLALELAEAAIEVDAACQLSVAGSAPFWSSGYALDAHVGALAQLQPAGWSLTAVRPLLALPAQTAEEEVEGLCRTTRALSEYAPVHISHGDLASLPAVAAGATSVGSGWDQRQRVCAYSNYAPRDTGGSGGGSWYLRPTFRGLLGSLTAGEGAVLARLDAALSSRLEPPAAPGPKEVYLHHLGVLSDVVRTLSDEADHERRYHLLLGMYAAAAADWPGVVTTTNTAAGAAEWIEVQEAGLRRYGAEEGW